MPSDDNDICFRGNDGVECEDFIRQVYSQAWKEGHPRDGAWIADFVSMCFGGKALRWYIKLPEETQSDWSLLRLALLDRWPSEDDEIQPQAPFTTPAGLSTSYASAKALPPGDYAIRNVSAKKVLNLEGEHTTPGTTIYIYSFYGNQNQIWSFEPSNQGYKIKNGAGTYIGLASSAKAVVGAAISGNPIGDEWQIQQCGNTYVIVLASNPGLVLDLAEANSNDRNKIVVYPQTGESSQKWILEPKA